MIGLIFGETEFPKKILKKILNKKKYLIIDLTIGKLFKKNKNSHSVSIGQFGKIIRILKENKCKKVLFAGKVKKPNFAKLKLDFKGILYISKIIKASKRGVVEILNEVIKIFEKEKIKTISSLFFTPELTLLKGNYTKIKPNYLDKKDIKKAILTLSTINKYNFTQGIIVRNEKILAIESERGTKNMLQKLKKNKIKNSGVLVKYPKKKQDLRIDLPTMGIDTLKQCKLAGLKGVVLKSNKNIFLDKKKSIIFANKNKMYISVK